MNKLKAHEIETELLKAQLEYDRLNNIHSAAQDRNDSLDEDNILPELEAQHLRLKEAENMAKTPKGGVSRGSQSISRKVQ